MCAIVSPYILAASVLTLLDHLRMVFVVHGYLCTRFSTQLENGS